MQAFCGYEVRVECYCTRRMYLSVLQVLPPEGSPKKFFPSPFFFFFLLQIKKPPRRSPTKKKNTGIGASGREVRSPKSESEVRKSESEIKNPKSGVFFFVGDLLAGFFSRLLPEAAAALEESNRVAYYCS